MRLITHLLLCCILLCASGAAGAWQHGQPLAANQSPARDVPAAEAFQNGGMTLSQAVEQVRRQYNGQIVSAETQVSGNRETHIIKVLTEDGKVKTVRVPGRRLN